MTAELDRPPAVSGRRQTDDEPAWAGVEPCSDPDCGDRLCLYRQKGELLAWCVTRRLLIGACPGCGTAVGSDDRRWPGFSLFGIDVPGPGKRTGRTEVPMATRTTAASAVSCHQRRPSGES